MKEKEICIYKPKAAMPLFEIHISVELKDGLTEIQWLHFCRAHELQPIKVFNVQGVHSVQNMIGQWCKYDTEAEALVHMQKLATTITAAHFPVVRSKVEAMMMNRQYRDLCLETTQGKYWEFHFKIAANDEPWWTRFPKLQALVNQIPNVGLSFSAFGQSQCPIVTLRKFTGTRTEVIAEKDHLTEQLKAQGFLVQGKPQAELSIYDSFEAQDEGWLTDVKCRVDGQRYL